MNSFRPVSCLPISDVAERREGVYVASSSKDSLLPWSATSGSKKQLQKHIRNLDLLSFDESILMRPYKWS